MSKSGFNDNLLEGRLFISTRPRGKSDELKRYLEDYGGSLVEMPMIEILPGELSRSERQTLLRIETFDWIVFTSANGILHFFEHLREITGENALGTHTRIAVIGKKTAAALHDFDCKADYINTGTTGEDFSEELVGLFSQGYPRVLLPVGNLARDVIEQRLRNRAEVVRMNVYQTVAPQSDHQNVQKRIIQNQYDMIIFTSPSGFQNFQLLMQNKINFSNLRFACIGNTTGKALEEAGVKPLIISEAISSRGIADAILEFYNKEQYK